LNSKKFYADCSWGERFEGSMYDSHEVDRKPGKRLLSTMEADAAAMSDTVVRSHTHGALEKLRTLPTESGLTLAENRILEDCIANRPVTLSDLSPVLDGGYAALIAAEEVHVRGEFVRFILLGGDAQYSTPDAGLRLFGAVIIGDINLVGTTVARPFMFRRCVLENSLMLFGARTQTILIQACRLRDVSAQTARISGELRLETSIVVGTTNFSSLNVDGPLTLENCSFVQPVEAPNIRVDGPLNLQNSTFQHPLGDPAATTTVQTYSLALNSARITGPVLLDRAVLHGTAILTDTNIGSFFSAEDVTVVSPGNIAINADRMIVNGSIGIEGAQITGTLRAVGLATPAQVSLDRTTINDGTDNIALILNHMTCMEFSASRGFTSNGSLFLSYAKVSGDLSFSNSTFGSGSGAAVAANFSNAGNVIFGSDTTVSGSVVFADVSILGRLQLRGTNISGALVVARATLGELEANGCAFGSEVIERSRHAIYADRSKIKGNFSFSNCELAGTLSFYMTAIDGQAFAQSCKIISSDGLAIYGAEARIGSIIAISNDTTCQGTIDFTGIVASNSFIISNSHFTNTNGAALIVRHATIGGDIKLTSLNIQAYKIDLSGSTIDGSLIANDLVLTAPEGRGLADFSAIKVREAILLENSRFSAGLQLSSSQVNGQIALVDMLIDGVCGMQGSSIDGGLTIIRCQIYGTGGVLIDHMHGTQRTEVALVLSSAKVGGDISLLELQTSYPILAADTRCGGTVAFSNCEIGLSNSAGVAIDLTGADIKKAFAPTGGAPPHSGPNRIAGIIDLSRATIGQLIIFWDRLDPKATFALCDLRYDVLDIRHKRGVYEGTLALLKRQPSEQLGVRFQTQPFEQASKALKNEGREVDARGIQVQKAAYSNRRDRLLAFDDCKTALTWPKTFGRQLTFPAASLFSIGKMLFLHAFYLVKGLIYGRFLGAGYATTPPILAFILVWALGVWIYASAAEQGAFTLVNRTLASNLQARQMCAAPGQPYALTDPINWTSCAGKLDGFNEFRPVWYSLDLMLQFGPLGQRRDWEPSTKSVVLEVPTYGGVRLGADWLKHIAKIQAIVALFLYGVLASVVARSVRKD
jgi:hypothetical protein